MSSKNGSLRIAFDTWSLSSRFRNQGIHTYAKHLLKNFRDMGSQHLVEVCPFFSLSMSNDANSFGPAAGFSPKQTALLRLDRLWRFGGACGAAFLNKADLIFFPSGVVLPLRGLIPAVTTIHDVTPVVMPSFSRRMTHLLRFQLRNAARLSEALITDSNCSKRDIVNLYGVPESKVSVVYLGYDKTNFNDAPPNLEATGTLLRKLKISKAYILHHGVIQPRKNLKRLIEAYRLMLSRNRNLDFDLVLAGPLGWQYEETLAAGNGNDAKGRVVFSGALDDPQLAMLVKGASLVVIPSLYEGFCLPMVEAMACGTPTIAANSSCLPEVSGGVLKYFDPRSTEDIATCMEEVLESDELKRELAERGKHRAASFDWQRCAEQTLEILTTQCIGRRD
ncbi:MAG: glycosyl transferase, group 1 [Acidobacteriaceae bacterium]|nr:glycosyl transferase, group 1 [Acidobacteriaceae bacterium]